MVVGNRIRNGVVELIFMTNIADRLLFQDFAVERVHGEDKVQHLGLPEAVTGNLYKNWSFVTWNDLGLASWFGNWRAWGHKWVLTEMRGAVSSQAGDWFQFLLIMGNVAER